MNRSWTKCFQFDSLQSASFRSLLTLSFYLVLPFLRSLPFLYAYQNHIYTSLYTRTSHMSSPRNRVYLITSCHFWNYVEFVAVLSRRLGTVEMNKLRSIVCKLGCTGHQSSRRDSNAVSQTLWHSIKTTGKARWIITCIGQEKQFRPQAHNSKTPCADSQTASLNGTPL